MKKEAQSVILHGDCWNNNFMFKYEDENKNSPSNVKILDWQLSQLLSPVIDLSYFIYINSSQSELDQLDELLETYYFSFSEFLRELGSKAEELFTFEDLKRHWNKYCAFGALFTPYVLKFVLCDKETAPAFEDLQEGQGIGAVIMDIHLSDMETYYKRAKAVLAHYFNNKKGMSNLPGPFGNN
ncbi:hypothetical protein NQ317_017753 [Molorchus minor]|uniref:CHK kinase-like domain-containing protein n=1 Tax=Molorchus minor TaxID=1323400 RepID=A0ABQ9JHE3_9CUCU|nr:hypothetical protein NQ317_017753 [Molorchus minor]